jgi:hypothetical protein
MGSYCSLHEPSWANGIYTLLSDLAIPVAHSARRLDYVLHVWGARGRGETHTECTLCVTTNPGFDIDYTQRIASL